LQPRNEPATERPSGTALKRQADVPKQGVHTSGAQIGVRQSAPDLPAKGKEIDFNPLATASQISSSLKDSHGVVADGQENWAPKDPQQKKSYDTRNRVRSLAIPNAVAGLSGTAEKEGASPVEVAKGGLGLAGHIALTTHGAASEYINNSQAPAPKAGAPATGEKASVPQAAEQSAAPKAPSTSRGEAPLFGRGEKAPLWMTDPWPSTKTIEADGWPRGGPGADPSASGSPSTSGSPTGEPPAGGQKAGSFYQTATPAQRLKMGAATAGLAAFTGSDALGLAHSIQKGDVAGAITNGAYLAADAATTGGVIVGSVAKNPAIAAKGFHVSNAAGAGAHLLGAAAGGYSMYDGAKKLSMGDGTGLLDVAKGGTSVTAGAAGLTGLGAGIAGRAGLSALAGKIATGAGVAAPLAIGLTEGSLKAADRMLEVKSGQAATHAKHNLIGDKSNIARASAAAKSNVHGAQVLAADAGNQYQRLITNNPVNQLLQAAPRDAFQNGVKPVNNWLDIATTGDNGGLTQIDLNQRASAPDASGLSYMGEGASRTYTLSKNRGLENFYRYEQAPIHTAASPGQAIVLPGNQSPSSQAAGDLVYYNEQKLDGEDKYGPVPDAATRASDPNGYYNKALPRTEAERAFRRDYEAARAGVRGLPDPGAAAELNKFRGNPIVRSQVPLQGSEITTSAERPSRVVYDSLHNPSVLTLKHRGDQLEFLKSPNADVHVNVPDDFKWNTKFAQDHDAMVGASIRQQTPWESGMWDYAMGSEGSPVISFNGTPQAFEELRRLYGAE